MIRDWPTVPLSSLTGDAPITVLAPHPDDETLGCGGLLAHAFAHHGAHVICLTDGSASHPASVKWTPLLLAKRRRRELERAIATLGGDTSDISWLGLQDGQLYTFPLQELAARICEVIDRSRSKTLFAPAMEDHHADHQVTARIALLIAQEYPDLTLYSYPIWSRWDAPDFDGMIRRHRPFSVDCARYRNAKRAAIASHASQLHGGVDDDPDGFAMKPAFVEKFVTENEIFWRTRS